ncbi:peptidase M14, partial [Nitratireductor sp. GCM10026969]
MTILLEKTFERTLDRLVADHATPANRGGQLEAWVFEDTKARQAGERRLAEHGVTARIRSAYKPLVHAFLEEIDLQGVEEVRITYPVLADMPNRFRLEAYPLAALGAPARLVFTEGEEGGFTYRVALVRADGRSREIDVFAPNRVHTDPIGMTVTSPTGWLKWTGPDGDTEERRLETDYEALFSAAVDVIARYPWGEEEPYFDALSVRVKLPVRDRPLSHGHESISLCEALHEDLYFSVLEIFQKKSGRPLGDRGLRPGQIVPEVLKGEGAPRLRVEA